MGCSGGKNTPLYLDDSYDYSTLKQKWDLAKLDIKNKITHFLNIEGFRDVSLGIYEEITFIKEAKAEITSKVINRKIFLLDVKDKEIEKLNKIKKFLGKFFTHHHCYQGYNNCNFDIKDNDQRENFFSPYLVLSNNYDMLISQCKKNIKDEILFLSFTDLSKLYKDEIKELKKLSNSNENYFIIDISNTTNSDMSIIKAQGEYSAFIGYTVVFYITDDKKPKKPLYWFRSDLISKESIQAIEKYITKEDNQNNIFNTFSFILNKVNDFIRQNCNDTDEYEITLQLYQLYDYNKIITKSVIFPIILKYSESNNNSYDNDMLITTQFIPKVKEIELIENSINNLSLGVKIGIETFKEKRLSILHSKVITYIKYFTLLINKPLPYSKICKLENFILEKLNPMLKSINRRYRINHIVILPKNGKVLDSYISKDNKSNNNCFIIINHSNCLNYISDILIEKYKEILNENIHLVIYGNKNNNLVDYADLSYCSKQFAQDEILNCYFRNFNDENYSSHIFIITNDNKEVIFSDFFRNSNVIYFEEISNNTLSPNKLPEISEEVPKKIKNDFYEYCNEYLSKIKEIIVDDKILNVKKCFQKLYNNKIYHQPFMSLKYNKIGITNCKYKNFTVNIVEIPNDSKSERKDELEIKLKEIENINEICKFYSIKDSVLTIENRFIKCIECNKILYGQISNQLGYIPKNYYSYYLCPISRKIFCMECESKLREKYLFNLMYIHCCNLNIALHISLNNADYFKNVYDSKKFREVRDNICDICSDKVIKEKKIESGNNRMFMFFLLANVLNRSIPCLICLNCFNILISDNRNWQITKEYEYVNKFVYYNFIDLDNLVFKRVIVVI